MCTDGAVIEFISGQTFQLFYANNTGRVFIRSHSSLSPELTNYIKSCRLIYVSEQG